MLLANVKTIVTEEKCFSTKSGIMKLSFKLHPQNAHLLRVTEAETSYDRIAPRLRSL